MGGKPMAFLFGHGEPFIMAFFLMADNSSSSFPGYAIATRRGGREHGRQEIAETNTSAGNILTLGPSPLMGEGWGEGE